MNTVLYNTVVQIKQVWLILHTRQLQTYKAIHTKQAIQCPREVQANISYIQVHKYS